MCIWGGSHLWSLCAACIKSGSSSRICTQRSTRELLGAICWKRKQIKQTLLYMPFHVSQNCCPAKEKRREMTQCLLKSCYKSLEAQCSSPCWKYRSSGGNPAVWVCLFCPSAYHYSDKTTLNKLTKALELNRVIICALLAVALITWLCIQTEAIFTDFLSKKLAFISIWGENIKGCLTIIVTRPCRGVRWNRAYTLHCSSIFTLNRGP